MSDSLDEFELELSRLRPQSLSQGLTRRVAAQLDKPTAPSTGDRCLVTFMGAGALAASVIVGLLSWDLLENRSPTVSPPPSFVAQHPPQNIAEYQQAVARSNDPTLELLR